MSSTLEHLPEPGDGASGDNAMVSLQWAWKWMVLTGH